MICSYAPPLIKRFFFLEPGKTMRIHCSLEEASVPIPVHVDG